MEKSFLGHKVCKKSCMRMPDTKTASQDQESYDSHVLSYIKPCDARVTIEKRISVL